MKTCLPFLLSICSFFVLSAQVVELPVHIEHTPYQFSKQTNSFSAKTTACGIDTVMYPTAKATAYSALNINNLTSASAGGQYFDAPQPITISGVEFYAYSITEPSINAVVEIYSAGPNYLPTGSPLASVTVAVDSNFGGGDLAVLRKVGVFSTPVTVIGAYVVVVRNNSGDFMGLVANSYSAGDGALENLSSLFFTSWFTGTDVTIGTDSFNADWIFHPLVSYDLTANFVQSFTCLEDPSTSVAFVNLSSAINANRMYNQAAYLGVENFSYTWDFDNGGGPVNTFDSIVNFIGTGPYNVSLKDTIFGWTSQCADSKEVILYGKPDADFSSNNTLLQVAFYDSSSSADNNISYLWDFGDGNTSTMQNPVHDYLAGGVYNVCLYATNNCSTDTICKNVGVNCPLPEADYTMTVSNIFDVDFTDVSTDLDATSTWSWNFDDGQSSTLQNPSHTYAAAGVYNVCLTVTNDCGVDSTCMNVEVTCNPPVASFSFATTTSGLNYAFTNTSSYDDNTVDVLWDLGDGNTSTQDMPIHEYAAAGNYEVCLKVTSVCGVDSTCSNIDVIAGIKDLNAFGAELFPNPSTGQFTITLDALLKDYTLNIYSSIGNLVHTQEVNAKELYIDIAHLNKGLYFIELNNQDAQYVQKIILH